MLYCRIFALRLTAMFSPSSARTSRTNPRAAWTRKLLVPIELRICFPHRPVQRLVADSTFMQITAFACHYDNTSVRKLALPVYGICQNTYIFSQTSMCGLNEGVTYMRVPSCSKQLDHAAYKSRHVSLYFTRS